MPARGEDAPELAHLGELTGLGDVCEEECERGGLGGDHMLCLYPGTVGGRRRNLDLSRTLLSGILLSDGYK